MISRVTCSRLLEFIDKVSVKRVNLYDQDRTAVAQVVVLVGFPAVAADLVAAEHLEDGNHDINK